MTGRIADEAWSRAVCREVCAYKGEPACWSIDDEAGVAFDACDDCQAAAGLMAKLHDGKAALPDVARCVAYDLDECTVTVALDDADQVRALVEALPAGHRVRLMED